MAKYQRVVRVWVCGDWEWVASLQGLAWPVLDCRGHRYPLAYWWPDITH